MKIDIITLFPDMFKGPFDKSIVSRAQKKGLVKIKIHQLRDWAVNRHGQVDDRPYGGGAGMLLRVDVAYAALQQIKNEKLKMKNYGAPSAPYIVLPTPRGKKFDQKLAVKLSKKKHLIFLCPHYEGYDHRIESLVDEKISIGDYVLTGGELPVMSMVDAIVRLIPGVIKADSLKEESFSINRRGSPMWLPKNPGDHTGSPLQYEYPQYTRPEVFEYVVKGKKVLKKVPKVLLSGNHQEIANWRKSKTK